MLKRINELLNIIVGATVGVFVGHGLYVYGRYRKYPELYAIQSAPWYTSILLYGGLTLVTVAVCAILKVILGRRAQR